MQPAEPLPFVPYIPSYVKYKENESLWRKRVAIVFRGITSGKTTIGLDRGRQKTNGPAYVPVNDEGTKHIGDTIHLQRIFFTDANVYLWDSIIWMFANAYDELKRQKAAKGRK